MAQRRKGIQWYVIIAFAITWGALVLIKILHLPLPESTSAVAEAAGPAMLLSMLASFGPAIAATVVRKWITREGFADAGLGLNLTRGWKYYLAALLFPLLVVPIAVLVAVVAGLARPDFGGLAGIATLLITGVISGVIYFGEEFGWRSYLQDRVAPGKPLPAALWTGLVWGIWHWPFVFFGWMFGGALLGLLFYLIDAAIQSVFLGWLRSKGKSVWPACLAHGMGNAVVSGALLAIFPAMPELTWCVLALAGYVVLALILVLSGQVQ